MILPTLILALLYSTVAQETEDLSFPDPAELEIVCQQLAHQPEYSLDLGAKPPSIDRTGRPSLERRMMIAAAVGAQRAADERARIRRNEELMRSCERMAEERKRSSDSYNRAIAQRQPQVVTLEDDNCQIDMVACGPSVRRCARKDVKRIMPYLVDSFEAPRDCDRNGANCGDAQFMERYTSTFVPFQGRRPDQHQPAEIGKMPGASEFIFNKWLNDEAPQVVPRKSCIDFLRSCSCSGSEVADQVL
jgi:hypothetical protein